MKSNFLIAIALLLVSCSPKITNRVSSTFEPDTLTHLRNPYMGWTLYSLGIQKLDSAETYWELQDEAARRYADVYYIRWPWAAFEPEEGKYAWDHDENFKGLIQGALDRGLRLAFRVVANGRDCSKQGIPEYVFQAGADFFIDNPGHKNAYPDDPVFLEKYTKFIKAFGEKFNDPRTVDFVDCYGLGWWGEEHNVKWKDKANRNDAHDRIVRAYAEAFDKVITVVNYGVRNDHEKQTVYDELGFSPRRDGYVSEWFPTSQYEGFVSHFPRKVLIAEACYRGDNYKISDQENGKWPNWQVYYKELVDEALKTHINFLDMRTPIESKRFLSNNLEDVQRFITKGGYRIYPKHVEATIDSGKIEVRHSWTNLGVGVLPNNNVNLGYKYKVAFALFDINNKLIKKWFSNNLEVSSLVGTKTSSVKEKFDLDGVENGVYKLGVGIINQRENDSKDITLAIQDPEIICNEWVLVGSILKSDK